MSERVTSARPPVAGVAQIRTDAIAKVTGAAEYAVDCRFPGMLEGRVIRSDRAHALLRSIDINAALATPGCVGVFTAADLDGLFPYFGHFVADQPVLALGRVRYFGEPVALVVAKDRYAAEDAAAKVLVEYEDLSSALTMEAALADAAPAVHDQWPAGSPARPLFQAPTPPSAADGVHRNVLSVAEQSWGDADEALATAPVVVETRAEHPMIFAYGMEPYNATARVVDGVLEVVSPTQHPFMAARELSRMFSLPQSKIRVSAPFLGGGFGAKSYTKVEPLACIGAWLSGRPVRVVLDIEESMYTGRSESATTVVRSGFDLDGNLLARSVEVDLDAGAYADNTPQVLQKAVNRSFGPYRIPHLKVRGRSIYTNTSPAVSLRSLGAFQVNIASETNMDQAAERLEMNPAELRKRNMVGRGEQFIPGMRPMDADLCADLDEMTARLKPDPVSDRLTGVGFGCGANEGGSYPTSTAQVRIAPDGSALVLTGSTEMGQGSQTVLTQIAAQELRLPMDRVQIRQGDTFTTAFERTTGGSRTTTVTGVAIQRACANALAKLSAMAAEVWDVEADVVEVLSDGKLSHGELCAAYGEILRQWYGSIGGEVVGIGVVRKEGEFALQPAFWEVGMVGVVVDIDPGTGAVAIDQLVTVADVGFAVNPAGVAGQELGGAVQGMGAALSEELVYEGQQIQNANLVEYRVPRTIDRPRRHASFIAERGDGVGPYGAKGAGEGSRIPVGGAVIAAVARATGRWPQEYPLTPERVWRLINDETAEAE